MNMLMAHRKMVYDPDAETLYTASEGLEAEAIEIANSVFECLDANGELIGAEILHAYQICEKRLSRYRQRQKLQAK